MPIFYHIDPSDVRNRTGTFRDSFDEHQRSCKCKEETVVEWKRALKQVGQLKGWHIQKDSSEANVIKEVKNTILRQLKKSYVALPNFLVGVEDRVENMERIISAGSGEEKIIGMYGPGGIGKTTLAKIVYNQLSNDYQGCSFLANVRETSGLKDTGIMRLQNQLIYDILKSGACTITSVDNGIETIIRSLSRKKVLICFDDVSNRKQLKGLLGDSSWFGPGSKIIITTRNKELLTEVGAYSSYEVPEMDSARSLQLFSNLAFRRDSPPPDYMTYSERVVKLTGGLPLALEVIGSLLHGKPKHSWESKLQKLEKVPHKDVQESLMISYEELDDRQKEMFLDVACFFVGFDKTTVLYFWDFDLHPSEDMEVLEHMSLLKIKQDRNDNNIIWMHDQIIDFGRSLNNRSRLREDDEAYSILKEGQREESVEAMKIQSWKSSYEYPLTGELFTSVPSLKLLHVWSFYQRSELKASSSMVRESKIKRQNRGSKIKRRKLINSSVLPQLRWLSLKRGLDPQDMWSINLCECKKLVILELSETDITHEWGGWSQLQAATNLKVLDLSDSYKLKMTPDLSAHGKLERLILCRCSHLIQIHESIVRLKQLVFLDLNMCRRLKQLPEEVGQLESLDELDLTGCRSMSVLPGSLGNIKSLKVLKLVSCESLREIPSEIGGLSYLTTLILRTSYYTNDCMSINQVPKLPESLICLHLEFDGREGAENEVPDLSNLVNLRELELRLNSQKEDPSLLWWIGRLSKLETLKLNAHNIPRIWTEDDDLGSLSLLKTLHLNLCFELQSLPRLPSSLVELQLYDCTSLKSIGDISNLKMLSALTIKYCRTITEIRGLDSLKNLKKLKLKWCDQLLGLPRLPGKLADLDIYECPIKMLNFSDSVELKYLRVKKCPLEETRGLDCLVNLSVFNRKFYSGKLELLQGNLVACDNRPS